MVDEKRIIEILEEVKKKDEELKELFLKDYAKTYLFLMSLCEELNIDGESKKKIAENYVENHWDKIKQELKDTDNIRLQIEDIFKKEKDDIG
jgi:hypothetical protein